MAEEVRAQFKLATGSKIKVIVDGETIILKPRAVESDGGLNTESHINPIFG